MNLSINNIFSKIFTKFKLFVLAWINPIKNTKDFYKKLALDAEHPDQVDGYIKKYGETYLQEEKEWIASRISNLICSQDKVIDIGCGTGRYLKSIQEKAKVKKIDINLYGVDISEETLELYTKKNCSKDVILDVVNIVHKRPFEGINFDLVYSISIIQHIPFYMLSSMFENVYRALKDDGYFYIVFPEHSSIIGLLKNPRYTRYPINYVIKTLIKKGFEVTSSGLIPHNRKSLNGPGSFILAKKTHLK